MARARFIWVLTRSGTVSGAFTLKYELITYISQLIRTGATITDVSIERHGDGMPYVDGEDVSEDIIELARAVLSPLEYRKSTGSA